jgi:hypothetical protein
MRYTMTFSFCLAMLGASAAYGRRPGPPPQEAIEACQDAQEGDACTFEGRDGRLEGTCFRPRDDVPLACRPARAPKTR